jgi:hypothetical protein
MMAACFPDAFELRRSQMLRLTPLANMIFDAAPAKTAHSAIDEDKRVT